jgi:hypothetical protein
MVTLFCEEVVAVPLAGDTESQPEELAAVLKLRLPRVEDRLTVVLEGAVVPAVPKRVTEGGLTTRAPDTVTVRFTETVAVVQYEHDRTTDPEYDPAVR